MEINLKNYNLPSLTKRIITTLNPDPPCPGCRSFPPEAGPATAGHRIGPNHRSQPFKHRLSFFHESFYGLFLILRGPANPLRIAFKQQGLPQLIPNLLPHDPFHQFDRDGRAASWSWPSLPPLFRLQLETRPAFDQILNFGFTVPKLFQDFPVI